MTPALYIGSTLLAASVAPSPLAGMGEPEQPIFDQAQLEQITMRRFNPLPNFTATALTSALNAFEIGELAPFARLCVKLAETDRTLMTVKPKREEAIALRPRLVETLDDSPEAKDQQAVVEAFLASIRAGHALNRHITGGAALLVQQMMESVSFFYAVHHLRFAPDAAQTFVLPSGATVPTLRLTCEQVPLEYFEARTGELRFLGADLNYNGTALEPNRWMVTTGPGLMKSASIAIYEGRLARHDRLNLSAKWGQPAIIGHTTAGADTAQFAALKTAVAAVGANYRGAVAGSDRNAIEALWPTGGGGGGGSPMKEIMDDTAREIVTLYLGGDLSTISRAEGVGASLQGDSAEDRQRADCVRIGETLTATLVPIVVRWYFGDAARVLVRVVIEAPDSEDSETLGKAVDRVVSMGGEVPVEAVAKRLGVPLAKAGEVIFTKPAAAAPMAFNAAPPRGADSKAEGKLLAAARELFPAAKAKDLQALRKAIARVLQQFSDDSSLAAARALYAALPRLAKEVTEATASEEALYRLLSTAAAEGLAKNPQLK